MKIKYVKIGFLLLFVSGFSVLTTVLAMRNNLSHQTFQVKEYPEVPLPSNQYESWSDLYHKTPKDSPARFALNEIATRKSWRAFRLLKGKWPGTDKDREEAAERLKQLGKRIELGLKWPYKTPPFFEIPYTKTVPKIDGNLNDACWNQALSLKGSYPIDSVKKKNDGSIWKMMWNEKYLYTGAYFSDKHILASTRPGHPYCGDSFELFLMPSKRMKKYWEIIIGCNGELYDGFHCNNRHGGCASEPTENIKGIIFKVLKQKDGFTVEVAVPFLELPNYMLGNQPKTGETIHFAMIRTNKTGKDGDVEYNSAFPLLYGGHNIFGHAKSILKK